MKKNPWNFVSYDPENLENAPKRQLFDLWHFFCNFESAYFSSLALDSGCTCEPGTKPKQMVAKQSGKIISNAVKNLNDFNYRCQANIDNGNSKKLLDNVETEVENLAYHVVGNTLEYPISLEIIKK